MPAFFLIQRMFNHTIHAAAAGSALETGAEVGQIGGLAGGHYFHVAVFGVAHPSP